MTTYVASGESDTVPRDGLTVEYCGAFHELTPGSVFTVGREGDLVVDEDNPYLHRVVASLSFAEGFWWVQNVGSRLSVTVSGEAGTLRAVLGPGAKVPIVLRESALVFAAGDTTYEVGIACELSTFAAVLPPAEATPGDAAVGTETLGAVVLTDSQLLLLVALAEPRLRRIGSGPSEIPSNATAAGRLGWSATTFNRKLDNVCEKFTAAGVKGLHGGPNRHAVQRRVHLVEYAIAARIVTADHLGLLAGETSTSPGIIPHRRPGAGRL